MLIKTINIGKIKANEVLIMKLNLEGRIKYRSIVEEKLKKYTHNIPLKWDGELKELIDLEELLFERYELEDGRIIKIPVWTGEFLQKLDLSEISFENVLWDVSQYGDYLSKDLPVVSSVNLMNTNANIHLARPQTSFNIMSNCNFEGTDLSSQTIYLSEFGNVSDAGLVIMPNCNFRNTGVYVVLNNEAVNDNLIGQGEENKARRQVSEMIKNGVFDGCYVDGYLVENGKITEQKAPNRKAKKQEEYEAYQRRLLDSIEETFKRAK